jgi:hypothetical protein
VGKVLRSPSGEAQDGAHGGEQETEATVQGECQRIHGMMEFFAWIGITAVFCGLIMAETWTRDRSAAGRMALNLWGGLGAITAFMILYVLGSLVLSHVVEFSGDHPIWAILIGVAGWVVLLFSVLLIQQWKKHGRENLSE